MLPLVGGAIIEPLWEDEVGNCDVPNCRCIIDWGCCGGWKKGKQTGYKKCKQTHSALKL